MKLLSRYVTLRVFLKALADAGGKAVMLAITVVAVLALALGVAGYRGSAVQAAYAPETSAIPAGWKARVHSGAARATGPTKQAVWAIDGIDPAVY